MSNEELYFLDINDVHKSFGEGETRQNVLTGMNFHVSKGEFCVLLGPSGSGKSTLLNIIGGIDNPDSGFISINGDKLIDMNESALTKYRRKHLGYVFQQYNLIPNLNVKENIEVGAYLSDNPLDIDDLLVTLGLYEHRYKLPNQLSGGQQQRVSIGRAIVKNPDILLCDEPTGALDFETGRQILVQLEKLARQHQKTVVIVTHTKEIAEMGDSVITMKDGKIISKYENERPVSAERIDW
jgi:putative ABC transport system ATP-binding protein